MEGPSICSATPLDEAETAALWQRCGLIVAPNDPVAAFRLACGGPASDVLIARDAAGRIVGAAMVGHDGHRGYLHFVAVDEPYRRRGLGRRLVAAAEDWVRRQGMPRMHLMVRETNLEVTPFYEALGFARMPYLVMSKWLDADS